MYMMRFFDKYLIVVKSVHHLSQVFIELKENIHPDTEIRGIEKSTLLFPATSHHLIPSFQPTGCPGNHRNAVIETPFIIFNGNSRHRKFNSDVSLLQLFIRTSRPVILVYYQYNLMSAFYGNPFDHFSHLTISQQSYTHIFVSKIYKPHDKAKRLYRVKVNIYFSSKLQLSYKIYKQKKAASQQPFLRIFVYHYFANSFAFATTALKASG